MSDSIKQVVFYEKASGRVVSSGTTQNPELLETALIGVLIDAAGVPDQSYVHEGAVMDCTPIPSPHHIFDWANKCWADPRTLQDFKDAKWAEIKKARDSAEFGGFTWDGSLFDSDSVSQSRIQGAMLRSSLDSAAVFQWTLADNTVRTLSAANVFNVGMTLGQHVVLQHGHARDIRVSLAAATTTAQIALISW